MKRGVRLTNACILLFGVLMLIVCSWEWKVWFYDGYSLGGWGSLLSLSRAVGCWVLAVGGIVVLGWLRGGKDEIWYFVAGIVGILLLVWVGRRDWPVQAILDGIMARAEECVDSRALEEWARSVLEGGNKRGWEEAPACLRKFYPRAEEWAPDVYITGSEDGDGRGVVVEWGRQGFWVGITGKREVEKCEGMVSARWRDDVYVFARAK